MNNSIMLLMEMCERLSMPVAEIRGEGRSQFIYATMHGKAVELSEDVSGFFVEGWAEASEDSDASPEFSGHFDSLEKVEVWLREWSRKK